MNKSVALYSRMMSSARVRARFECYEIESTLARDTCAAIAARKLSEILIPVMKMRRYTEYIVCVWRCDTMAECIKSFYIARLIPHNRIIKEQKGLHSARRTSNGLFRNFPTINNMCACVRALVNSTNDREEKKKSHTHAKKINPKQYFLPSFFRGFSASFG